MLRLVIEELIHDGVVVHDVAAIRFPESSLDLAQEVESVDRFINRHIVRQGLDDKRGSCPLSSYTKCSGSLWWPQPVTGEPGLLVVVTAPGHGIGHRSGCP